MGEPKKQRGAFESKGKDEAIGTWGLGREPIEMSLLAF
jgi:hypothetical protein